MASLGRLVVDLLLSAGSFESSLDRAAKTSKKRMKEIERSVNDAGKVIGTALAAGAVAAGYAIKQAIDQADQLNEISKKIGIPTDVLSGLNYAAKLAGVATEELSGGLAKMVRFQADAAKGGQESSRVFSTLGIGIKDASGALRDSNALFGDFANIFSRLQDGPEKAALAMQVFGKSGADLIPLLNEGKAGLASYAQELRELGGIVTPATAAAADEFKDNLDKLKVAFGGVALQAAEQLLPALTQITAEAADFARDGQSAAVIARDLGDAFLATSRFIRDAADEYRIMRELFNEQGFIADDFFGNDSLIDRLNKGADARIAATERSDAMRKAGLDGDLGKKRGFVGLGVVKKGAAASAAAASLYTPSPAGGRGRGGGAGRAQVDEVAQAYERMNAQMAETIALFGQTSEVAKLRYKLENGELATLSQAQKDDLMQKAAIMDVQVKDADLLKERNALLEAEQQTRADARESVKEILGDMQFELDLMGKTNAERVSAIELRRIGLGLTGDEIAAAKLSIESKATELEAVRKQIDALDEFRGSFADSITDVLTGAESMGDAFKSLADTLVAQIARILANRITENIFGPAGSAGGGSGGGLLSSIFSLFTGSSSSGSSGSSFGIPLPGSGLLPGFATGTNYAPGGYAVVGEKGPEIVNLPRGSQVIPNNMIGRGGGRGDTFNVNVPQGTTKQTASYLAAKTARAVRIAQRDS